MDLFQSVDIGPSAGPALHGSPSAGLPKIPSAIYANTKLQEEQQAKAFFAVPSLKSCWACIGFCGTAPAWLP